MDSLIRLAAILALCGATSVAIPAAADYDGPDGYGNRADCGLEVSHDGYVREGQESTPDETTTYVIIETESGTPEQLDGETVIVVQEPEPTAATEAAPPAPRVVAVDERTVVCPEGIWVEAYWGYTDGEYVWVDGHCVVERVNYVFVQPRWDYYSNVWWFVPGYYRPWGVYVGFGYYRPRYWYPPHHYPYYRTGHPVPVHRGVPRRPTTVRATPNPTTRRTAVARPGYPARTGTVERRPPTTYGRTGTVGRVGSAPTRTGAVSRTPTQTSTVGRAPSTPTRTSTVGRAPNAPPRTSVVGRVPSPRTTGVSRTRPSATRVDTASRGRASTSPTSLGRVGTVPARTGAAPRPSTPRPSLGRARGGTSRPSVSRSGSGASRGGAFGRSGVGGSRVSPSRPGSFGRPSFGASRSSMGRSGGVSRPSSRGFGGSRSVPTARGR